VSAAALVLAPIAAKHAARFVELYHRKLPHAHHRMWAVGLWDAAELRGVALVGLPMARSLTEPKEGEWPAPANTLEVVRVAVLEDTPNGCSMLYGAVARAARAMGCRALLTYTAEDEPGTTLRAAGWVADDGLFGGGQADRPGRHRRRRTEDEAVMRRRWWAPWSVR
jgi:hypothetical protein